MVAKENIYHYTESGLANAWLANGYKVKKPATAKLWPLTIWMACTLRLHRI